MPPFNQYQNSLTTSAITGDLIPIINGETVAGGYISEVLAVGNALGFYSISFTQNFASAPTAVVVIYGSNLPPTTAGPQGGVILNTWTSTQIADYSDNNGYAYYWAQVTSYSAGGALTVVAHVR